MTRQNIDLTDGRQPQEKITFPTKSMDNKVMLCGPGCSCGKPTKTGKLKIVIMLIVLAAVVIALIYRGML